MLFNSIDFLIFFPIVALIYFIIPQKVKWIWLLVASYYFYMCWNPKYAVLMGTSTVITYLSGIFISKCDKYEEKKAKRMKKICIALSFISNLAILVFFKYFGFIENNLNKIFDILNITLKAPSFDVLLPVGISFYTFQALGYTMDVYRKDVKPEKNPFRYALFVSFFPQLVAGPIERSKNLIHQLREEHRFEYERVKNGLLLMLWGFFQKLVIADRVAILVNTVYNNTFDYEGFQLIIATVLFAVQIYCDFSSYSDIAIGAAQVMGFKLMQNFKRPYFSKSIAEFWRRWHISLSTWFKDYLYFPLGGSRKGKFRTYINIMIIFIVSGLWHGAAWTFIIWGFLHGAYQVFGRLTRNLRDKIYDKFKVKKEAFSYKLGQVLTTFSLVSFAWILFRANSISDAIYVIKHLFVWNPWILTDNVSLFKLGLDRQDFELAIFSIFVLICVSLIRRKNSVRELIAKQGIVFRWTLYYLAIFAVLIFGIYGPGYNASEFIYFQF
ncbi:MAG: MBOAT family protein [Lachnospiraceae bacterium]|jgi:D-alanyl-lipoteichoic acid acyltransferase DltB (MBOAT superfamily)|nr:MBOAT family protein [Lachnospiraceae bacterium]